jgi:hypothetical protein
MDNPWSQQAADTSLINEGINMPQRQRQDNHNCFLSCLQTLVRSCHVGDGILGILLIGYGMLIRNSHLTTPLILTWTFGTLLLARAVFGLLLSVHHEGRIMRRLGLRLSAVYLSPLFALVDFMISFLCMGNHAIFVQYLQAHASQLHLSERLVTYIANHHRAVWILFLSFSLLELIRWYMISNFHTWLLQMDTLPLNHSSDDVELLYTPIGGVVAASTKRPWWWQQQHSSRETLQEPLLHNHRDWVHDNSRHNYSMHHGVSSPTSFWSRWFPSQNDDEEEVDFASVQEEWASKSQQDPFWWSREEGESIRNSREESRDEEKADLSWVVPKEENKSGN